MATPGGNLWSGVHPSGARRFAAVVVAVLLAGGPVFADVPAALVAASQAEGPDPSDEVEDAPAVLWSVHRRDALPNEAASAALLVVAPSPPRAGPARTARPATADPFGNGLGLRLRC